MLLASRATAGPTPHCIECGARARYIDLNASWQSSCSHFNSELTTEDRLEAEVRNTLALLKTARARLRKFRAHRLPSPSEAK